MESSHVEKMKGKSRVPPTGCLHGGLVVVGTGDTCPDGRTANIQLVMRTYGLAVRKINFCLRSIASLDCFVVIFDDDFCTM